VKVEDSTVAVVRALSVAVAKAGLFDLDSLRNGCNRLGIRELLERLLASAATSKG
jgi:hypothetical protein